MNLKFIVVIGVIMQIVVLESMPRNIWIYEVVIIFIKCSFSFVSILSSNNNNNYAMKRKNS